MAIVSLGLSYSTNFNNITTMNENEILIGELNAELASLMSGLAANTSDYGDWKIIKIYEARLQGKADPYNFDELSAKREQVRQRINEIQNQLEQLGND